MDFFLNIYNFIFYQPIYNALVYLYNVIPGQDIGVSIIVITIILKVLLHPFSIKALRSQKRLAALQPKIKELQNKYKDKKEELAKATMALYADEKVSPFSSCLPIIVQFPFLIAIFQILRVLPQGVSPDVLYSFIQHPGVIDPMFLGIVDLANRSIYLAVLAGAAQLWQALMLSPKPKPAAGVEGSKDEDKMAKINRQMTYFMPILTVIIGIQFPGGLALYWLVTNLLTVGQQWYFFQKDPKEKDEKK